MTMATVLAIFVIAGILLLLGMIAFGLGLIAWLVCKNLFKSTVLTAAVLARAALRS